MGRSIFENTQKLDKLDVQIVNKNDEEHCREKINPSYLSSRINKRWKTKADASLLNSLRTKEQKQALMDNKSERKKEDDNVEENEEENELPVLLTLFRKRIRAHQDDSLFVYFTFLELQNTDSNSS